VRNALTVDVEEWFHICGVDALGPPAWSGLTSRVRETTRLVLDELDRAEVTATFLFVGWVAERYPDLVTSVLDAGHRVGCHSHWHRHVHRLTPAEFDSDLACALDAIRRAGAPAVASFRAPEWSIRGDMPWALEALARHGLAIDSSLAPVRVVGDPAGPRGPHLRETPAGGILEMPPLVTDRFGQVMPIGWGWALRMSSPRRILRAIDDANRCGHPAVLTIHPWEIDPDPPRVSLPWRLRFAHYFRLEGFTGRLRTVLREGRFAPLETAAAGARAR
jgi:polysaccharide deacetylase family protein (PEP-CTERM system associated)